MKITILGTNGFLSSTLGKYYADNNLLYMYGLDAPHSHAYTKFFHVNLVDEELDYSQLLDSDIIIYTIGAGIQSNLKEKVNLIFTLNVTIPVTICNVLNENSYKGVFLTFGSYFEIGLSNNNKTFTEKDIQQSILKAPNDYAVSKRMLTSFASSVNLNFTYWHFILPTIYGEKENPQRLIPYTVNSIKNGQALNFTSGDQIRQYIYVEEVAKIIELALEKKILGGIYNIAGNEILSVKELVIKIHQYMNKKIPQNCFGTTARQDIGMKYLVLDGSKLYKAIDFIPSVNVMDVINRY